VGGSEKKQEAGIAAKGGLRIALAKDNQIYRLPNGAYGLAAWYPAVAEKGEKKATKKTKTEGVTNDANAEPSESEENGAGEGGG